MSLAPPTMRARLPVHKATVYFMLPEAYSLFEGGESTVAIGGAGAGEFFLADALSADPELKVVWIFPPGMDVSNLTHPRIEIRSTEAPSTTRIPLVDKLLKRRRLLRPFADRGPRVLVGPPFYATSNAQWLAAERDGVTSVLRVASDSDVVEGGGRPFATYIKNRFLGSERTWPWVVVQSKTQYDSVAELTGGRALPRTVVVNKGWGAPSTAPAWGERNHILWVGSCRPVKQPQVLIELARRLPDEQFTMVLPPFCGYKDSFY